jgi:hypothetical protein
MLAAANMSYHLELPLQKQSLDIVLMWLHQMQWTALLLIRTALILLIIIIRHAVNQMLHSHVHQDGNAQQHSGKQYTDGKQLKHQAPWF